jgi:hypothetical protein
MSSIDMGQADSSLYRQPLDPAKANRAFSWYRAIGIAAKQMGFASFFDVPDSLIDDLHGKARIIREDLI